MTYLPTFTLALLMLASANNTVTHTTGYVVVNGVHEFSKSFSEGLITADITWLYLYKSQTTLNQGVSTTSALSATTLTDSQDGHFFKTGTNSYS